MKVKPIGSNMTEVERVKNFLGAPVKYTFLVSYETPVAVNVFDNYLGSKLLITQKKWSRTTSRHISKWMGMIEVDEVENVPQTEIERLFDL
jgi:hypothetical protein